MEKRYIHLTHLPQMIKFKIILIFSILLSVNNAKSDEKKLSINQNKLVSFISTTNMVCSIKEGHIRKEGEDFMKLMEPHLDTLEQELINELSKNKVLDKSLNWNDVYLDTGWNKNDLYNLNGALLYLNKFQPSLSTELIKKIKKAKKDNIELKKKGDSIQYEKTTFNKLIEMFAKRVENK